MHLEAAVFPEPLCPGLAMLLRKGKVLVRNWRESVTHLTSQ